jgi:hypothetical protein
MNEAELLIEYAKCWNNKDVSYIRDILCENLEYTSQWVFETMYGKDTYLQYLSGKFATLKRNWQNSAITAEVGFFRGVSFGKDKPCLVITQILNGQPNKVTILIEVKDGKIAQIAMCGIPHPNGAELFEMYPK